MKWTIVATFLLSPLFSFAQTQVCEAEAVAYARDYMDEVHATGATPVNVFGSGKADARGVVSYGVEFLLDNGEGIIVVPMMSADCTLLEIQGF
ncbi:MAG: hypothetical protein OM95_09630 [Bdellovibrio sp. ArHS]|uniref:hypothetical protein n=1 Tax=Bdellovibrio sp. ArHS TaxID=1569284 RepID=UPI0005829C4E|nr:hypothetical protein [Bdellovibrio sp. ArHS]KHD88383.1 MAG: hypothetical protein OM95_09630 [Bdellovibrio sp. ArHS]